jgi:hypothetical protein
MREVFVWLLGGSYVTSHVNVIELGCTVSEVWRVPHGSEQNGCSCIYQGKLCISVIYLIWSRYSGIFP